MVLQVTSPFRGSACIAQSLAKLEARPDADAVVGMMRIDRAPRQLFAADQNGYATPLSGGDTPRSLLTPNGALYLVRTEALRRTGSLFPPRTLPLVMNDIAAIDIDDEDDWQIAEAAEARGLTGTVIG